MKYIAIVSNSEGYEINPTTYLIEASSIIEALKTLALNELGLDEEEINFDIDFSNITNASEKIFNSLGKNIVIYSLDIDMKTNIHRLGTLDW